jgi:DNA-binding XRE family transcriptional regulator
MIVSQNLKELIHQLDLTNASLARAVGKTKTSIGDIISGKSIPKIDIFINLKKQYPSLNLNWLFTGQGPMWLDKESLPDYNLQRIADLEKLLLSYEKQIEMLEKEIEQCKDDLKKYDKNYGKAAC